MLEATNNDRKKQLEGILAKNIDAIATAKDRM